MNQLRTERYIILIISLFILSSSDLLAGNRIAVADTIRPIITVQANNENSPCNQTSAGAFQVWYNDAAGAEATDNSGQVTLVANLTFSEAVAALEASSTILCGNTSSLLLTWTAVDDCGNESLTTTSATFNTTDLTKPSFITFPTFAVFDCVEGIQDSLNQWVADKGGALVADACSDTLVFTEYIWTDVLGNTGSSDFDNPIPIPVVTDNCDWFVNVSFFVMDECGNEQTATGRFTIVDNETPSFSSLPIDVTISCNEIGQLDSIYGVDVCQGNIAASLSIISDQGSDDTQCNFYNYNLTRSWVVADACGNSASHSHEVVVQDVTAPDFSISDTIYIQCEEVAIAHEIFPATNVLDNCSSVTIDFSDVIIGGGCDYEITRTWMAVDICGNGQSKIQTIFVEDTSPPIIEQAPQDVSVSCDALSDIDALFTDWLTTRGAAVVRDSCFASYNSFAAIPGSYDINDPTTFPGSPIGGLETQACPTTNGFLHSVAADFVFYDNCGNAIVSSSIFGLTDTTQPTVENCVTSMNVPMDPASCQANVTLSLPDVSDNCGESQSPVIRTHTELITSTSPGDNDVPVDSVTFNLGPFNLYSSPANGDVTLTIEFVNMDMDDPTEVFFIKGEDGTILDTTVTISNQCEDLTTVVTSISAAQINQWAADGFVQIRLVPDLPSGGSVLAINDVCGGSSATITLSFDIDLQTSIRTSVQIDQGQIQFYNNNVFPLNTTLSAGVHEVVYTFYDCADNQNQCVQMITIEDVVAPMISCPTNQNIDLANGQCTNDFQLATDFVLTDNCSFPVAYDKTLPSTSTEALLDFSYNSILDTFLADNIFFSFTDVRAIQFVDEPAILEIRLTGDINENGEQFEIFGEGGTSLGLTSLDGSQDCGSSVSQFLIDTMTFNAWAANDEIAITALAPTNSSISGGGINNCVTIGGGSTTDGISMMTAQLIYQDTEILYHIEGATTVGVTSLIKGDSISTEELNGGSNLIVYEIVDAFGNIDSCSYEVVVADKEAPVVECMDAVIFIHPSGLIDYELKLDEIHLSSSDNCEIDSFSIAPNFFDCTLAGSIVGVTLEAFDAQGNSASCVSQVRIETPVLMPSFTAGVCPGDTLQFFGNVPTVSVPNAYTFSWTGPNFSSMMENPFIPNPTSSANGTYTLTTTGFNGCTSVGTVEVALQQLTVPTLESDNEEICIGSDILLSATSYNGSVMYQWYEGISPNGILLQTTPSNNLLITPTTGTHYFYVIVESPDCVTEASNALQIEVIEPPIATVQNPFITLCEGENLVLGTDVFDPSYTYFWTGPNGYDEEGASPAVVDNVTIDDQGTYKLVIDNGVCFSDTATSQVVIFNKPETPVISGENIFCEGNPILFTVNNVPNADQYMWYLDGAGPIFNETDNNLFIPNATANLTGNWTAVIQQGLCHSDTSEIKDIIVDAELQIGAGNSSPICDGDSVELTVSFIPGATYMWESPNGTLYAEQNPFVPGEEGSYSVTVSTPSGCESISTTDVVVDEQPVITALSNNSEDCMDGSTPITFFPTVIPAGNFNYEWMGPNFMSNDINPEILNASSILNGAYSLIVYNGQCASEEEITDVDITDIPDAPQFTVDGFYCQGDDLVINTDTVDGAIYYWDTPVEIITTTDPTLIISNVTSDNNGFYQLYVEVNGCQSLPSDIQQIVISAVPSAVNIVANNPVCEGDLLTLQAGNSTTNVYEWEGPGGFTASSQDTSIAMIALDQSGIYRVRVLQNNCPSEWTEIDIEVLAQPDQPQMEEVTYDICLSSAMQTTIELCLDEATIQPGASYEIYINGTLLGASLTGCFELTSDDVDVSLDNEVYVIGSIADCKSIASEIASINLIDAPDILAMAMASDIQLCDEDNVTLLAQDGPPLVNVSWTTVDPNIDISDPNNQQTDVNDIPYGNTEVVLSYSSNGCPDFSTDTVYIYNQQSPTANLDTITLVLEATGAVDLLSNDLYEGSISVEILSEPDWGSYIIDNGFLTFTSDPRFSGETTINYEICLEDCPDNCDQGTLHILVSESVDCIVPTIITPNGDNVNDALIIPCFIGNQFVNNSVVIFNQWGDEVYSAKPYKNDWQGTYNGSDLPVGTYFIVVDRGDDTSAINSFIMIER